MLLIHDEALRKIVGAAVAEACRDGDIAGDPVKITRLLLTAVNGMQVEARKGISHEDAEMIVDTLLELL